MPVLTRPEPWSAKPPIGTQLNLGHPLAHGLVALWPFGDGGGVVRDVGDRMSPGSLLGTATWQASPFGPAISMSGAGNRVEFSPLPDQVKVLPRITMAALIKPSATSRLDHAGVWLTGSLKCTILSGVTASKWQFFCSTTGSNNAGSATGPTDISTSRYDFVVGTFDGATVRCFVNGRLEGSTALAGTLYAASTEPLKIGASGDAAGGGSYAYVGIWNYAMPPTLVEWLSRAPFAMLLPPQPLRRYAISVGGGPVTVTPSPASLTLTAFAPTVSTPRLVTPSTATLTTATFAPVVSTPRLVTPATLGLTLTGLAPVVSALRLVTPGVSSLTLAAFAPLVSVGKRVTPTTAALSLTAFAPAIVLPRVVTPAKAALSLTSFAPTVGAFISVTPTTASLTTTAFAPTVLTPRTVVPSTLTLTLTRFAPTVTVGTPTVTVPATATLTTTRFAPVVSTPRTVTPARLALVLASLAPTVSAPRTVTPAAAALTLTLFAPSVAVAAAFAVFIHAMGLDQERITAGGLDRERIGARGFDRDRITLRGKE